MYVAFHYVLITFCYALLFKTEESGIESANQRERSKAPFLYVSYQTKLNRQARTRSKNGSLRKEPRGSAAVKYKLNSLRTKKLSVFFFTSPHALFTEEFVQQENYLRCTGRRTLSHEEKESHEKNYSLRLFCHKSSLASLFWWMSGRQSSIDFLPNFFFNRPKMEHGLGQLFI